MHCLWKIIINIIGFCELHVHELLYGKDYANQGKWIPVIDTQVTGPLSYKVQNNSGQFYSSVDYY